MQESVKIDNFAVMNLLKKIFNRLKKDIKLSASNPHSFDEVWSINTTGFRVISLSIILIICIGVITFFIASSSFFQSYLNSDNKSIDRTELEQQSKKIEDLSGQLLAQEDYIQNIKYILTGQLPIDYPIDSIEFVKDTIASFIYDEKMTPEEKKNLKKVKEDMLTQSFDESSVSAVFYVSPVKGIISQEFNAENHQGIDIVTKKGEVIKACLSGVIIYSAYTHKDGNIVIIEHENSVISIYKHAQRILKKSGDIVKIGDPIGIVGNSGENSDGPHLHFELWQNLKPIDPLDHIRFTQ